MRCVYALLVLLALNGCASEKRQTFVPINPAVNRTDGERDTALQLALNQCRVESLKAISHNGTVATVVNNTQANVTISQRAATYDLQNRLIRAEMLALYGARLGETENYRKRFLRRV